VQDKVQLGRVHHTMCKISPDSKKVNDPQILKTCM